MFFCPACHSPAVWKLLLCVIIYTSVGLCADNEEMDTLTTERYEPGLEAPMKLWWVKQLTSEYYVAGALTPRWIKYVTEGGFKSVVSLCNDNGPGDFAGEYLPSSYEASIVAKQTGIEYAVVLNVDENDDWASVKAVEKLTEVLSRMPTPALLHCNRAYTVTFTALMYIANRTRYDSDFASKVSKFTSEKFYKVAAGIGFDYTMEITRKVVSEITGEPVVENPLKPNTIQDDWLDYWPAHAVYRNWYIAGQLRRGDIKELEMAGFKAVVNLRQGVTFNGKPSQEAVTLLNIRDNTPTYGDSNFGPRQLHPNLRSIVLDPKRDTAYISTESELNYESKNDGEFGDEVGYNETMERMAFEKEKFPYFHLPVEIDAPYSPEVFGKYKDQLLEIGKSGPVLVHCAKAKRAAYITVLAAAMQHKKSLSWALTRVKQLGFEVSSKRSKDRHNMFYAWLDPENYNRSLRDEL